jgi:Flp pilus assembly protein TadD
MREAVAHYQKAVKCGPREAEPHFNLAKFFAHTQPRDAIELYERALELDPQYNKARTGLGAVYVRLNLLDEAVRHLREAVRLDPDEANAYMHLAIALAKKKQFEDARHQLREALRLQPGYAESARSDPILGPLIEGIERQPGMPDPKT